MSHPFFFTSDVPMLGGRKEPVFQDFNCDGYAGQLVCPVFVTEQKVGDSSGGQRLMLRRNGTESLFRRRQVYDFHDGAGKGA